MRDRRVLGRSVVVLVCAAVGLSAAPAVGAEATPPTVPTVSCHTTFGVPGAHPKIPARLTVHGNPRSVRGLVAYSEPYAHVLAPAGMNCAAIAAADGGQGITVWRRGEREPRAHSPGQGVTLQVIPACRGCMYALVCPFDRALANRIYPGFDHCAAMPPAKEQIARHGDLMLFSDPPGVAGDASPSGGPYWAYGAVGYSRRRGAFAASCTLAGTQRSVCTTVLNDAIGAYYEAQTG